MLWIQQQYELRPQFYHNLLLTFVVLVGLWLLRRWVIHLITRRTEDARVRYSWRRTTNYIYFIASAIALVFICRGELLTIRYLCKPHERRKTADVIWEQILAVFEQHADIELTFPTTHVIQTQLESG